MLISGCERIATGAVGANFMQAQVKEGRAYPFCDRRGSRIIPVEFVFSGTKTWKIFEKLYFSEDERMVNRQIKAIEIVSAAALPVFGNPEVDNPGATAFGWLTLVDDCENVLVQIPLPCLDRSLNGGKLAFFDLKPNYSKSYLTYTGGGALTASNGLFFNFHVD